MSAKEGMSGQVGSSWIRVLLRQKTGEDGKTSRPGEDGAVPRSVPVPCGRRGDLLGPGSAGRGQAPSRPRHARRAICRGAQGAWLESPAGGDCPEAGKRGRPRSVPGESPHSPRNRVRSCAIHAPGSLGRQPTGFVPGSRPTLGGNDSVTFCGAIMSNDSQYKLVKEEFTQAKSYASEYHGNTPQAHFFNTRLQRVSALLSEL